MSDEIIEIDTVNVDLTVTDTDAELVVEESEIVLETASVGPQGPQGATGATGPSNVLSVGSVTSGGTAAASITGTSPSQILNLVLPKGDTGATGPKGDTGATGATGATGPAGPGVPSGGSNGQILQKLGATDYSAQWVDFSSLDATATNVHVYVKNGSGQALTKGQVVYISGASGANPLITLAKADTEATSSKTLGVLKQDLAINAFGYVITEGFLEGLNTGLAQDGDPIWLSGSTAGGMLFGLANKPSAPTHMVFVGYVLRAQSQNGVVYVKPQNGFELQELHNVAISSPSTGQTLNYNSSTGLWSNTTPIVYDALGAAGAVQTNLDTHTNTTTSVHGIANTANLLTTSSTSSALTKIGISTLGVVHSDASGNLTSSGVANADVASAGLDQTVINGVAISAWSASTPYVKGDLVSYQGVAYRRKVAGTTSGTPSSDTANWAQQTPTPTTSGAANSLVATDSTGKITAGNKGFATTGGINASGNGNSDNILGGVVFLGNVNDLIYRTTVQNELYVAASDALTADGVAVYVPNGTVQAQNLLGAFTGPVDATGFLSIRQAANFYDPNGGNTNAITVQAPSSPNATSLILPTNSGTLVSTGDTGSVSSQMIANGTIVNGDISASAAISTSKIAGLATSATTDTTNASNISSGTLAVARGGTGATATTGTGNNVLDTNPQFGGGAFFTQPAPTAINTTATLTAAQVVTYILTSTTAAAVTATLPTGTNMDTQLTTTLGVAANTNISFDISVINTGATNTFTIATATGWTLVGSMVVNASTSAGFRIRKTASNTFTIYRLS